MHVTSLKAIGGACYASSKNAHVVGILDGKCPREVTSPGKIYRCVGWYADGVVLVISRCIMDELPFVLLRLFLCLVHGDGGLGGEEQEVVGDVTIKLHAHVFGLEQEELHRGVVLHIGDGSLIVGSYLDGLVFLVLADDTHKHVAGEVEKGVGYFANLMFVVANGGIYLGHIGVYLRPLLAATGLDENIVVVFQGCAAGGGVGEYLVQLGSLLHVRHFHLAAFSSLLCLGLQCQHFLRVRHLQPLHIDIMVVGRLVNVP